MMLRFPGFGWRLISRLTDNNISQELLKKTDISRCFFFEFFLFTQSWTPFGFWFIVVWLWIAIRLWRTELDKLELNFSFNISGLLFQLVQIHVFAGCKSYFYRFMKSFLEFCFYEVLFCFLKCGCGRVIVIFTIFTNEFFTCSSMLKIWQTYFNKNQLCKWMM